MDKNHLAVEVKKARVRCGDSRAELSWRCGLSSRTIYLIEAQRIKNPRPKTIARIAIAVGKDPNEWLPPEVRLTLKDVETLRRQLNRSEKALFW